MYDYIATAIIMALIVGVTLEYRSFKDFVLMFLGMYATYLIFRWSAI